MDDLTKRIESIEKRNKKVELDKAWEGSVYRRVLIVIFTYLSIGIYMWAINVNKPWLNAVIPSIGFTLSTLTLPLFKEFWIKKIVLKKEK
jgi:uncharacterized membrane protein YccC